MGQYRRKPVYPVHEPIMFYAAYLNVALFEPICFILPGKSKKMTKVVPLIGYSFGNPRWPFVEKTTN
ncbi:hypothetical protein GCM10028791_28680 [Echinicola sediminis]